MQRCGECTSCRNPHHKKACSKLKAAREADRASRHEPAARRHMLLTESLPLAKVAERPESALARACFAENQPQPNNTTRDSRSPSVAPDAEAQSSGKSSQGNKDKRAATGDSDNLQQGRKRIRYTPDSTNKREPAVASGVASRVTLHPVTCQTQASSKQSICTGCLTCKCQSLICECAADRCWRLRCTA